ncbi:MAG TPA: hypothetical protein VKV02_06620 [Acidobacteriaceae bacterium]|nr:hypothetical protein [Acidobacteriaceae bacterium]
MSNEHTKHAGKDSLEAMHENDAHTTGQNDAVPGGAHAHSPAAHEAGPKAHTKPAENERTLITAEEERSHRLNRGADNNRGAGAGLRGDSGTRGQ